MAINKRKILQSAQKHVQKGAFEKALEDYKTVLKADPKDSNIRLKVGDLYLKLGKTDDAVASYLKVAERFMNEGFDAKAVALFKQVTKLDPKRHDVFEPLADVYQRMGLTQDAMKALQVAADAAYKDGDKIEALGLLRKMGALDPGNTTNRMKVADLLHQEGQDGEAVDEYMAIAEELERQGVPEGRLPVLERVLEIEPERLDTLLEAGRGYIAMEQWQKAEVLGRTATAAHPDELDGHELLGLALEGSGQEAECKAVFHHVADVYRERGDEDRARDLAQRYGGDTQLSMDDGDAPVLETGGSDAFGDSMPDATDEAAPQFTDPGFSEEGMSLGAPIEDLDVDGPEDADAPLETDLTFEEELSFDDMEGEDAAAAPDAPVADATPSLESEEAPPSEGGREPAPAATGPSAEDPEGLLAEASVYLRYGKHERAIESLRAVVSAVPDHATALEKLGEALTATGDSSNAVTAFERAASSLREAGDDEALERVVAKLSEIDAEAAQALASAEPSPDAGPAPTPTPTPAEADDFEIEIDEDVVDEEMSAPERTEAPSHEADTDLDDEFEIDLDASDETAGAEPADEAAADADGVEGGEPGDFEIELDLAEPDDVSETTEPTEAGDDSPELSLDGGELEEPSTDELGDPAADEPVALDDLDVIEEPSETEPQAGQAAGEELDELEEELAFGDEDGDASDGLDADAPAGEEDELVFGDEGSDDAGTGDAEPDASEEGATFDEGEEISGLEFVDEGPRVEADATDPLAGGDDDEDDATDDPTSGSATTPAQIVEDLEEAEFYYTQGMLAEARPVYERILSLAPGHAKAMLRLGELEAAGIGGTKEPEASEPTAEEPAAADAGAEAEDASAAVETEGAEPEGDDFDFGDDAAGSENEEAGEEAPADASASSPEVDDSLSASATEPAPDDPDAGSFDPQGLVEDEPSEDLSKAAEGDSFDLAAELSDVLGDSSSSLGDSGSGGGTSGQGLGGTTEEEGFEQVFAAFKQGVEGALDDDGDQQAHYDLGIAYREMGLLDDAIGEFQQAMSASDHRLPSLHMMALCALDLGRAADAVAHLEQGLSETEIPEENQIGLRFDLGRAHAKMGDLERARACFEAVQAIDPTFCDVEQVLAELTSAPDAAVDGEGEAFESFDDLIGGDDDEDSDADAGDGAAEAEAAAEPAYESFDDLMGDDDDEAEAEVADAAVEAAPEADPEPAEPEPADVEPAEPVDAADEPVADEAPDAVAEPAPAEPEAKPKRGRRKKISFV